uniref:Rabphilin n=1 Tax=Acrobeloides nanus TaxID=290746 RepID=A0A914EJY3_9BILA
MVDIVKSTMAERNFERLNLKKEFLDLMNDWEIGGTQNPWVCPSDRHLQLRAQLKSGWSVRTASARSPTNAKQNNNEKCISEAEQEQIRRVLARAEAGKKHEEERLGKMVDRLEKMRSRANGNGVTQCLICQTEFGLLASKSYAAMCLDCRKYVCQKSCGVETYDNKRKELIFLCKICSEYREVMWKKSGAWFYKELPQFTKPEENGGIDESDSSSSVDPNEFKQGVNSTAIPPSRRHHYRPRAVSHKETPISKHSSASPAVRSETSLQRYVLGSRNRITDTDESDNDDVSRRTTPSTSPRHSIATPSSYGGDDVSQNHASLAADIASDAKSIDSGVVQSDHSNPQTQLHQNHVTPIIPIVPKTFNCSPNEPAWPTSPATNGINLNPTFTAAFKAMPPTNAYTPNSTPKASSRSATPSQMAPPIPPRTGGISPTSQLAEDWRPGSASSSTASSSLHLAKSTPFSNDSLHLASNIVQRHRPGSSYSSDVIAQRMGSVERPSSNRTSTSHGALETIVQENCVPKTNAVEKTKWEETTESPTFMSSPEDDSKISDLPDRPQLPKIIESGANSGDRKNSQLTVARLSTNKRSTPLFRLCFPRIHIVQNRSRDDSYSLSTLGSIQFNLTYLSDEKQLIIHLIRAKNLKAMDKNGFSDPYVKFHLLPGNAKATKLTSKTIEKTLNPEWHEELVYHGITEEERQRKTIRITVLDRDRIGSDFLGETRVALKKLPPGQMKKFNLFLEHAMALPPEKSDGGERGKLLVGVSYNIQQASLFVHIKRCAELLGMDSTGFSDPYCKVSLTPLSSKAHRLKTTIKKRTLNPEFNETLQFIVPFKDLPKKTLEIGVYDHDVGKHDDYIGGAVLSTTAKGERGKHWTQVIENPGKTFEFWHKLEV